MYQMWQILHNNSLSKIYYKMEFSSDFFYFIGKCHRPNLSEKVIAPSEPNTYLFHFGGNSSCQAFVISYDLKIHFCIYCLFLSDIRICSIWDFWHKKSKNRRICTYTSGKNVLSSHCTFLRGFPAYLIIFFYFCNVGGFALLVRCPNRQNRADQSRDRREQRAGAGQ